MVSRPRPRFARRAAADEPAIVRRGRAAAELAARNTLGLSLAAVARFGVPHRRNPSSRSTSGLSGGRFTWQLPIGPAAGISPAPAAPVRTRPDAPPSAANAVVVVCMAGDRCALRHRKQRDRGGNVRPARLDGVLPPPVGHVERQGGRSLSARRPNPAQQAAEPGAAGPGLVGRRGRRSAVARSPLIRSFITQPAPFRESATVGVSRRGR
jgi:hypothetical protein